LNATGGDGRAPSRRLPNRLDPTNPDAVMVDSQVIANAPVRFLVAGMGGALGTYFEGRASLRTESPSLEGTGITRAGMALAKLCYETLRNPSNSATRAPACNSRGGALPIGTPRPLSRADDLRTARARVSPARTYSGSSHTSSKWSRAA
jgi:hypothetical protein